MSPVQITGPLAPISLTALGRYADGVIWQVDQAISGLTSLTPVRGSLIARHRGNVVEVEGQATAIVTLSCDRCLQHYNQGLRVQQQEQLEIATAVLAAATVEQAPDELLDPRGSFDPERWLFEHLSLQHPTVNRCGRDCPGPPRWGDAGDPSDPRWAALARLRSS
ncbi:MAG: DUF177 domain-containing protein [Cyanobacteriota bacterium]|nr:DUF177 domain-containing protein [Cyanobacteriota bacterium]